jgi:hypothetical protein
MKWLIFLLLLPLVSGSCHLSSVESSCEVDFEITILSDDYLIEDVYISRQKLINKYMFVFIAFAALVFALASFIKPKSF